MLKSTKILFNKNPVDKPTDLPPTLWRKWSEEIKRAEVLINIGVFIVGLGTFIATLWVTWVAMNFNEKQMIRTEYTEFLRKTNDYLNAQWEQNSNLLSFLYAEAEYEQTLLDHTKSPEEILKSTQFYRKNDQQIHITLKRNEDLLDGLTKFVPEKERLKYQDNVMQNILEHKNVFIIIKHLNQALNYMTNDSFDFAEKELNMLIKEYINSHNININDPTTYTHTVCGARLATFYNLRALNRIKKTQIKKNIDGDTLNYCKLMEAIAIEDCNLAEAFNPKNFYTYLHKAYIYRELYKNTSDNVLRSNYVSIIKENAFKAYKIAPMNASTFISLGHYQMLIDEYMQAFSYFREALFLYPNNAVILYNLAKITSHFGHTLNNKELLMDSFNYADRANRIKPENVKTLILLINTALQIKECKKALSTFDDLKIACSKDPSCKREKTLEITDQMLQKVCGK